MYRLSCLANTVQRVTFWRPPDVLSAATFLTAPMLLFFKGIHETKWKSHRRIPPICLADVARVLIEIYRYTKISCELCF